jgi:hypothetical protein
MVNLNWWIYIQNVQSGMVIDVQGNAKTAGTSVWPYSLNHTNAQIFRVDTKTPPREYGVDACYIEALNAGGPDLYLSVKTPPLVIVAADTTEPVQPGTVPSDVILPRMVADQPSDKRVLRNCAFSIEEKRVPSATSPISVLTDLSVPEGPPKQVWKLVPVPGEEDVFFIQCADFEDTMVIESLDLSSGGTLALSSFTGADIQKWRIGSTAAPNATNLKLARFHVGGVVRRVTNLSALEMALGSHHPREAVVVEPESFSASITSRLRLCRRRRLSVRRRDRAKSI